MTEGILLTTRSEKLLDATKLNQAGGAEVHRQVMTIGDPTSMGNVADVVKVGTSRYALAVKNSFPVDDFFLGFGEADVSGASNNVDLWEGPTLIQPEPDLSGHEVWIVSSSPDDTLLGSGIQSVEIHCIDTAGVEVFASVDLNGLTPVNSGMTTCMFINDLHATAVGSGLVAAGNVDATSGSGGAVVARIGVFGNKSLSTMKQVPAGKNLILTGWYAAGVAATTKIANLRLRASQHNGEVMPGVYHYLSNARVKDFASPWIPLNYRIHPLATIKVSAWTSGSISLSAQWNGYLEDV